jgi:molybdenum cofactor biosynthesis enzyme MoaA
MRNPNQEIITLIYDPERNVFFPGDSDCVLPHVMWHITDECPLRCPYCFSPKTEQTVLTEAIDQILTVLEQLGVQKIDIGGGEPLVYRHLPMIVEKIRAQGICCTLTTSGVGRRENLELLPSIIPHLARFIVSLDAYGHAHNRLRGNVNAWHGVNEILQQLDAATRRLQVRINTVVTSSFEFESTFEQLARWIDRSGVREWCLIQPHPANQKETYTDYCLSGHQFDAVIQRARDILKSEVELIVRRSSLYSDYWVLHPSGFLQKHTNGAVDGVGVNIVNSVKDLAAIILSSGASAPLEEK